MTDTYISYMSFSFRLADWRCRASGFLSVEYSFSMALLDGYGWVLARLSNGRGIVAVMNGCCWEGQGEALLCT